MTATDPKPQDDRETPAAETAARQEKAGTPPPFNWQVLLLRYLPEPPGSTHAIKRLAPR
jgi:hypothetical protein